MEIVVALLMFINHEIKEHRLQPSMSECLKGKRIAERQHNSNIEYKVRTKYQDIQEFKKSETAKN